MTWFIEPLQLLENGKPSGKWQLTARCDRGGGFFGLCDHKNHKSRSEACACKEARRREEEVTGIPFMDS